MRIAVLTGKLADSPDLRIIAGPSGDVAGMLKTMDGILDAGGVAKQGRGEVKYEWVSLDQIRSRPLKFRKC